MTETRYLQLSVALPLVVPCALYALGSFELGSVIESLSGFSVVTLTLAGIPYSVLALISLAILWGREAKSYYKAAKLAPLLFVPFFALYIFNTELLGVTTLSAKDLVGSLVWSAILVVPVGYIYVFFVLTGAKLLGFSGKNHHANT